jgi:quercetin 2,3-dioxygenase
LRDHAPGALDITCDIGPGTSRSTARFDGELGSAEVGLFDRRGQRIGIDCTKDATALLLCGEPIDEPIVGLGPFVMNSAAEIRRAMADYQSGKMGRLSPD